jgi:diguanylate cyclase (GGDEF)-like protein
MVPCGKGVPMSRSLLGNKASRFKALFGIRARLVMLAMILVVPLMVDRVLVLENTRADQFKQAADELAKLARHNAAAQREVLSSVEALLRSAAYIQVASEGTGRGCAILRASLRVEMPWINSLSVVDKNGRISCSTAPNYIGINISDRPYYQKTIETHDFVVSDLIVSKVTNQPLLLANYPTSAVEGGDPTVIIAGLNVDWMARLMTGLTERPGVEAALLDAKGVVMAVQPADSDVLGKPYAGLHDLQGHWRLGDEVQARKEFGTISTAVDGIKKMISFVRIPGTDKRLVISIDQDMMLAPINHDIWKAYIQLALVSLLALLGAVVVGEQVIIQPIHMMTRMANRLGRGDLSARATGTKLPAEFKPLATAFNAMAAQLAERERDLVATNDRLTVMASVDMVSGLANRRGFQGRLDFEWLKGQQFGTSLALMMIDVDHFKLFNDNYGHPEGDACLTHIGAALAELANEVSGFAARYGGEEFCMLLPSAEQGRAVAVAEMIREAVAQLAIPHAVSEYGHVTVSVGVALIAPSAAQSSNELIEAADAALYAAKHQGRNTVVQHRLSMALPPAVSLAG